MYPDSRHSLRKVSQGNKMSMKTNNQKGKSSFKAIIADPFLKYGCTDAEINRLTKFEIEKYSNKRSVLFMLTPSRLLQDALVIISEWNFCYTDSVVLIRDIKSQEWHQQGKFIFLIMAVHNSCRVRMLPERSPTK